jgi:hypothetical protein
MNQKFSQIKAWIRLWLKNKTKIKLMKLKRKLNPRINLLEKLKLILKKFKKRMK